MLDRRAKKTGGDEKVTGSIHQSFDKVLPFVHSTKNLSGYVTRQSMGL